MAERRNHGQFLTRTSHGHVQSSPSPFRNQRSEAVRWIASPILPITDTNDDRVTLIPLNALQILDKEAFPPAGIEECPNLGMLLQGMIESSLDPGHVANSHGEYAERKLRGFSGVLQDTRHHSLNLRRGTLLLTVYSEFLFDQHMGDRWRTTGAGKCHQAVLINVTIREIDQTLVPTSVMPVEIRAVEKRIHRIEETLKTFGSACFVISRFVVVGCSEKSGGWQLLGVTGNHQFVPAQNRRNSILRQHLTGLVEDDEVEILLAVV